MAELTIYNSLSRKKEKFEPLNPPHVGMYTCGPTVYNTATIGNFRTYTSADLLHRVLKFNGFDVTYIMNLTDVGHLTGDNEGDADTGEDRMVKAVKREGKTAWQIADYYSGEFIDHYKKLNLLEPNNFTKATEHIDEQIELVKELEEKGFTYKTSDGIYFDTKTFEDKTGKKYGELSDLDEIKEGARVEANPEKKNPRDFALWKFSSEPGERHMEWDSPWGIGFPGWHIECSAMSMKYLGESFDIHVGGEDLRQTHHPNEIAQSEAATGKPFVKYWMHVTFLLVNGEKMSKSKGNAFNLNDILEKGIEPLALRYLYLTSHYKDSLNFTWESLQAAQNALNNLRSQVAAAKSQESRTMLSEEKHEKVESFRNEFTNAVNRDLDIPKALATTWNMLKSNIPSEDKYDLAILFDEVLGLNLKDISLRKPIKPSPELQKLLEEREEKRKEGKYKEADELRVEIEGKGFELKDTANGPILYSADEK